MKGNPAGMRGITRTASGEFVEVRRANGRLVRRRRLQRALYWVPWGLVAGVVVALLIALAARLMPWVDRGQTLRYSAAAVLGCLLVAPVVAGLWKVDGRRLLIAAELRLGLHSRLSTALALRGRPSGLSTEQSEDAARLAGGVDWSSAVPLRVSRHALLLLPLFFLCFLNLFLLPNPQLDMLARKREVAAVQKTQAEAVRQAARKLEKQTSTHDPAIRKTLEELDRLQRDLQQGRLSREEATARVSQTEAAIQEASSQGPASSRAALQRAASALASNPSTADLATAITSGDRAEIDKQARQLGEKMRKMSPQERARTQEALRNAAASAGGLSPELSKALAGAASGSPASAANLSAQMQAAASAAQTAQAMEGTLSQVQDSKSRIANAGTSRQTAAGAPSGDLGRSRQGQPGSGQQPGNNGQGQGGNQGQGAGQGQGNGQGRGSGGSTTYGGGGGGARTGTGRGNRPGTGDAHGNQQGRTAVAPPQEAYAPSRTDGQGRLVRVRGQQTNGKTRQENGQVGPGQKNAAVRPYDEAYSNYKGAASSYLDDHYIPITLKGYVRDYFDDIAPVKKAR